MTEFMQVVDAGDAVEHRPHLPLLERARTGRRGAARAASGYSLVQLREEVDQRGLLLLRQVRRTTASAPSGSRACADRRLGQLVADLGQVRARPVVAVLADLVAGQAARLRDHELARPRTAAAHLAVSISFGEPGRGAEVGQVAHRDDREDAGRGGDRPPLGPPLRAAVVERQQEQQDHADRRDADRRQRRRAPAA